MTTPTPEPNLPVPAPAPVDPSTMGPYPPYIPERSVDPHHFPESTLDGIHGDQGVVLMPPGSTLGPAPTADGPRMTQPYGPDDPELSRVWVPDQRPLAPGSVLPASGREDKDTADSAGSGSGNLNVNPADLIRASDEYAELSTQAAKFGPHALEEVQKVMTTHGAMGYPLAVGLLQGLAKSEAKITAKANDFLGHSEKLAEHAHTYTRSDHEGATRMGGFDFPTISV